MTGFHLVEIQTCCGANVYSDTVKYGRAFFMYQYMNVFVESEGKLHEKV